MKRLLLDSTSLAEVAYLADRQSLWVRFKNEQLYLYKEVDAATFEDLLAAHSKGRFFSREVRDNYEFERIGSGVEAMNEVCHAYSRSLAEIRDRAEAHVRALLLKHGHERQRFAILF